MLALVMALLSAAPGPASGGLLLVANKGDHTLGILDTAAGRTVAAMVQSGVTGHEVAASPDGRTAYVPIYGDSGVGRPGTDGSAIDVFDVPSRTRVATIELGRGERPHAAVFGPDGRLYVTAELSRTLLVIDPGARKVVDRLPTGADESHMVALSRDGARAYTSNVGPGTVSVLDVRTKEVLSVIPVAKRIQRIALSTDDRYAFTADQVEPRLVAIDTSARTVAQRVALPAVGFASAPTPDGRTLLVTMPAANKLARIDLATWTVTGTIDLPPTPQEVVVRPDGRAAYVSCDQSGQVAVVDLASFRVERLIPAGPMADGLALVP
jgi:YVTN family beta-propeller protein